MRYPISFAPSACCTGVLYRCAVPVCCTGVLRRQVNLHGASVMGESMGVRDALWSGLLRPGT